MSDMQQGTQRKRRSRKIWSCLECRRKKVQCDHGQPACGRCTKTGRAASCVYTAEARSKPGAVVARASTPTLDDRYGTGQLETASSSKLTAPDHNLLARLRFLEEKVAQSQSPTAPPKSFADNTSDEPAQLLSPASLVFDAETGTKALHEPNKTSIHGNAFRTRYHGSTSAAHLSEHIPGFASFTTDAFTDFSAFDQIKEYLNRSEDRTILVGMTSAAGGETHLKSLLPSRSEADRLLGIYFETIDSVYPVLHRPTFEQYYNEIWLGQIRDTRHIVVVLLVIAITNCLTSSPRITTDAEGRTRRDQATVLLDGCECWLQTRIQYYDLIIDYQIGFLLLLGRLLNARRNKRTWCNAANVARIFWCSGLNREPHELGAETSELDKNMRRRLWAAIVDVELQAAFEHGMPALSWPLQTNVKPPANAHDQDLDHSNCGEPRQSFTNSSFLALGGESIQLRHELNSLLNDTRSVLTFSGACEYTKRLKNHVQTLPTWSHPDSAIVTHCLLSINLHQYILALHEQQLRTSTSPIERQSSRIILVESATQVMEYHQKAVVSGSSVVEILYGTHLRAALSIGLAYCTLDPKADRILAAGIEQSGFRAVEQAIEMFSEKAMRFSGSRNLWYICAVYGLMKSMTHPENRATLLQEAVDAFTKPFYRLMALRQDLPSLADGSKESGTAVYANRDERQHAASPGWQTGPKVYDTLLAGPDKLAEWAFEDWTFDDLDLLISM